MFRRRAMAPEIAAANRRSFLQALAVVATALVWLVFASERRETSTVAPAEPSPPAQSGRRTVVATSLACVDSEDVSRLARYQVDNDPVALKRAAAALILSDRCIMLQAGETVILVNMGFSQHKVRRLGDLGEYWVVRERLK